MNILDGLEKSRRKEVMEQAIVAYKHGAEPSNVDVELPTDRAGARRLARALGDRGVKSRRRDLTQADARSARRLKEIHEAVAADEALSMAEDRLLHPVRSRLRRR